MTMINIKQNYTKRYHKREGENKEREREGKKGENIFDNKIKLVLVKSYFWLFFFDIKRINI